MQYNNPLKHKLIALALVTPATALAGDTGPKEVIPEPLPPEPAPEWNWFAGASGGYLLDFDETMYHAHFGVDLPSRGAWQHSLFAEVGWTETDDSYTFQPDGTAIVNSELEILPVTLNYKAERQFPNGLNLYAGAGVGFAHLDSETNARFPAGFSPRTVSRGDSDTVFAAQVFAGLGYDITEQFEVYGGARWIYLDDSDVPAAPGTPRAAVQSFDDDVLIEAGVRFNF